MSLSVHGRFFNLRGERIFLRAVTYGPFPPDKMPDPAVELRRIAEAGFNTVRLYQAPDREFLDLAEENGLVVMATVPWDWNSLFAERPKILHDLREELTDFLEKHAAHPALGALLIANEIRPDLVRFMGPRKVRDILEDLIRHCRHLAPDLLYAYANYPTSEYLEPRNADFSAFNVYLEDRESYRDYLRRLHNVAGDRPLLVTEFGFNTHPLHSGVNAEELEERQAEILSWAMTISLHEATAGLTVYAWSDLWFTGGTEVEDWSFGLVRRDGSVKPALERISAIETGFPVREQVEERISIAICTRNGGGRLKENLPYFEKLRDANFELLVIDDGSTDSTGEVVGEFAGATELAVRYFKQAPAGLSVARNLATEKAEGEIIVFMDDDVRPDALCLHFLRDAYEQNPNAAAAGGPNLSPPATSWQNAVVTACPGNVSHILLTDEVAEHLPGCLLSFRKERLQEIGGFDARFKVAGDDVDVCWRLMDAGYELAFHPAACVFHDRRATIRGFLKQQAGYGKAEALLFAKHPERFGCDGIRWEGFIYTGAPLSPQGKYEVSYGRFGEELFQMLYLHSMPLRLLEPKYESRRNKLAVRLVSELACWGRRRARKKYGGPAKESLPEKVEMKLWVESRFVFDLDGDRSRSDVMEHLMEAGWLEAGVYERADLYWRDWRATMVECPDQGPERKLHVHLLGPRDGLEVRKRIEAAVKG